MNTEHLREVLSWIKSTDLVEVSFKKEGVGFSLSSPDAASHAYPVVASRYTPVVAPCVGLFQFNEKGKARVSEEGSQVAEGDLLGVVVSAKGKSTQIKAPHAGRLARVMVDSGAGVEYGQPLFFVEPA